MRRPSFVLLTAMACLFAPSILAAQADPAADEAAVRAVVARLFDGMRARDTAAIRSTMHEGARLMSTGQGPNGAPTLRNDAISGFIEGIGRAPAGLLLDERIWDVRVQVDGNLATAWMNYAFFAGENLSHCGVNAMQLFRDTDGWKFIQIADTRRREGCTPPAS